VSDGPQTACSSAGPDELYRARRASRAQFGKIPGPGAREDGDLRGQPDRSDQALNAGAWFKLVQLGNDRKTEEIGSLWNLPPTLLLDRLLAALFMKFYSRGSAVYCVALSRLLDVLSSSLGLVVRLYPCRLRRSLRTS